MTNELLDTSMEGIGLIQTMEGLSIKPYRDAVGIWTIGYGHTTIAKTLAMAGIVLTEEQCYRLLLLDLKDAELAVRRLVKVDLTQGEFDALVSFTFNLGAGKLGSSTLLTKLNLGDHIGAAEEFYQWVHAGQEVLPGLVKRRRAEKAMFLKEVG
jgi:lysozyme